MIDYYLSILNIRHSLTHWWRWFDKYCGSSKERVMIYDVAGLSKSSLNTLHVASRKDLLVMTD